MELINEKPVALVTGANQGIGLYVAKELAANGFTVLVGARDKEKGETAAQSIGENAYAILLDVTNNGTITEAAARIRNEFGRLDLLVNNAGISHTGKQGTSLEEIMKLSTASVASPDEVRAVWETNVFGPFMVTQALLPLLREASSAKIVNVSSGVGSLTLNSDPAFPYRQGFGVVYGASKTALNAISLAFAIELESTNIKVVAVSPGFTATALNNFQGTDTIEEGSKSIIKAALDTDDKTGTFLGPDGILPW